MAEYIEYIERYDVLNIINDAIANNALSYEGCVNEIIETIAKTPAADVRPVVRGKWILEKDATGYKYGRCSECGMTQYAGKLNYCPNCGADMREES